MENSSKKSGYLSRLISGSVLTRNKHVANSHDPQSAQNRNFSPDTWANACRPPSSQSTRFHWYLPTTPLRHTASGKTHTQFLPQVELRGREGRRDTTCRHPSHPCPLAASWPEAAPKNICADRCRGCTQNHLLKDSSKEPGAEGSTAQYRLAAKCAATERHPANEARRKKSAPSKHGCGH